MQYPSPVANALVDTIHQMMDTYTRGLMQSGHITSFQVGSFTQNFRSCVQNIINEASQFRTGYGYGAEQGIHSDKLNEIVVRYGNHVLQQMIQAASQRQGYGVGYSQPMQQQPMFGQNVPMQSPMFGQTMQPQTTLSSGVMSMSSTPKPSNIPQVKQEVVKVTDTAYPSGLVSSGNPPVRYVYEDDTTAITYSMKCKSGPIYDVSKKAIVTDEGGNKFNYAVITSYINEISVSRVIDNFIRTNPKLCNGKWINYINYTTFDLRATKSSACERIDLSPLSNIEHRDVPAETIISEVIKNIEEERASPIVSVLSSLIVTKFNARSKRFLRISGDHFSIGKVEVENLHDIAELANYRNKELGGLTFHEKYEDTVLSCFKDAINDVILPADTPKGYFEPALIANDLLIHPNFVIRQEGICEREMDLNNPDFINMITNNFCAFSNAGKIVACNFIPDELYEDLSTGVAIKIEHITSPIDYIVANIWKKRGLPDTIFMSDGEVKMAVDIGVTLDGTLFMFRNDDLI